MVLVVTRLIVVCNIIFVLRLSVCLRCVLYKPKSVDLNRRWDLRLMLNREGMKKEGMREFGRMATRANVVDCCL